jgi:hypothetical protein
MRWLQPLQEMRKSHEYDCYQGNQEGPERGALVLQAVFKEKMNIENARDQGIELGNGELSVSLWRCLGHTLSAPKRNSSINWVKDSRRDAAPGSSFQPAGCFLAGISTRRDAAPGFSFQPA